MKKHTVRNVFTQGFHTALLTCALFGVWVSHPRTVQAAEVIGYYPAWIIDELPAENVRFNTFTRIVYAFAWPNDDASISSYNPPSYPELITAAHRAGRTVSISFGGGGQTAGFPKVTADPVLRSQFVANIIEFCLHHGYDGADFDWEFPPDEVQRDNYAFLIRELRDAVSVMNRPFLISMAVSAASWPSYGNDFAGLADVVDWFMVMTYNYAGTWAPIAGHNAPLYARYDLGYSLSVARSIEYMVEIIGYDRGKLVLGLPFYGREFIASVLYGPAEGGAALWYTEIDERIGSGLWSVFRDEIAGTPYCTNTDNTRLIVYDDPASIALKCEYALDQELAGVGVWAMGYDVTGENQPLVDAIHSVIHDVYVKKTDDQDIRPSPVHLFQNYPNPFNPATTIEYRLEHEADITLTIHNTIGQTVGTLAMGTMPPGDHTVTWDAAGLPGGVYICRLSAGKHVRTIKMVLVR